MLNRVIFHKDNKTVDEDTCWRTGGMLQMFLLTGNPPYQCERLFFFPPCLADWVITAEMEKHPNPSPVRTVRAEPTPNNWQLDFFSFMTCCVCMDGCVQRFYCLYELWVTLYRQPALALPCWTEREQSVLLQAAPSSWSLAFLQSRSGFTKVAGWRVSHVHLIMLDLLLLFVPDSAPLRPRRCLSHRPRPPEGQEVAYALFYQVRVKRANAGGIKGAC